MCVYIYIYIIGAFITEDMVVSYVCINRVGAVRKEDEESRIILPF